MSYLKHKSIIVKILGVILGLTLSIILFILAFWGILVRKPSEFGAHLHLAITLVILISVVSLMASFFIRKILKPLSLLTDAVEKVGKGNLDQTIKINNKDELGILADSFNNMTADLRKMIQAREQLLLDISHELRSPVTRAKLALEMMPDSPEKESIADDLIEMEAMVTEILDSERFKNGNVITKVSPVNVETMLKKLMEVYGSKNNRIILFPVSPDLIINVDEYLILRVLKNLVDNSMKYSSATDKPVEISVINRIDEIVIRIEDFGEGIPEDKLPFVFEPFYRADRSRSKQTGGYGLGLHLCKRIMDLHRAEITLQNKHVGKGIIASLRFGNEYSDSDHQQIRINPTY